MAKFKWDSVQEWLSDRIGKLKGQGNIEELAIDLLCLAKECDSDTLQDVFQDDMVHDGYFENQNECRLCDKDTDVVGKCVECDACPTCCDCVEEEDFAAEGSIQNGCDCSGYA